MAELFTDPMQTMLGSYKATTEMLGDARSKSIIQEAGQSAPSDADQSDIYSSAAKIALQQGQPQLAEKFGKQAKDLAESKYVQQSYKAQEQVDKLSKFEQDLQLINNPSEALEYVMDKDLPTQQKMQIVSQLRGMGNDPGAFKQFKQRLSDSVQDASTRAKGELAYFKAQNAIRQKDEDLQIKKDKLRQSANKQSGDKSAKTTAKEAKEDLEFEKEIDNAETKYKANVAKIQRNNKMTDEQKIKALKAEKSRYETDKGKIKERQDKYKSKTRKGGKEAQGGLTIGQVYPDANGNKAKYLGGDPKSMSSWSTQ